MPPRTEGNGRAHARQCPVTRDGGLAGATAGNLSSAY